LTGPAIASPTNSPALRRFSRAATARRSRIIPDLNADIQYNPAYPDARYLLMWIYHDLRKQREPAANRTPVTGGVPG